MSILAGMYLTLYLRARYNHAQNVVVHGDVQGALECVPNLYDTKLLHGTRDGKCFLRSVRTSYLRLTLVDSLSSV